MIPSDGLDRKVSTWLHADAEHQVPDHLDAVLRRTRTERQRPAWSSLERWLPVQTTLRLSSAPRVAWLLVVLGLIVSLAAAGMWIGSRQRLPNPFGPARNGAIVMSHDGDIYALDPSTHAERLIVGGDSFDFNPVFSRDGTKLLFLRGSDCRGCRPRWNGDPRRHTQGPGPRLARLVAGRQPDRLPLPQDCSGPRPHQRRQR